MITFHIDFIKCLIVVKKLLLLLLLLHVLFQLLYKICLLYNYIIYKNKKIMMKHMRRGVEMLSLVQRRSQ